MRDSVKTELLREWEALRDGMPRQWPRWVPGQKGEWQRVGTDGVEFLDSEANEAVIVEVIRNSMPAWRDAFARAMSSYAFAELPTSGQSLPNMFIIESTGHGGHAFVQLYVEATWRIVRDQSPTDHNVLRAVGSR